MMMPTLLSTSVDMMSAAASEGAMATLPPVARGATSEPMSGSTWWSGSRIMVQISGVKIFTSSDTARMLAIRFR